MKKILLVPFALAALGVVAAPVYAADGSGYQAEREHMDSPEHIQKKMQQYKETMEKAAHDGHSSAPAPDYEAERRQMDSPEHIKKEYQRHHKAMEEAAHDGHTSAPAPDYEAERRHMDSPEHIQKEMKKIRNNDQGVSE